MRIIIPLFLATLSAAQETATSRDCVPDCRRGYTCVDGNCISDCNPPCPDGYMCVGGDCEVDPNLRRTEVVSGGDPSTGYVDPEAVDGYIPNPRYIAIGGGGSIAVKDPTDNAPNFGELDIEHGGSFWATTIGLGFPSDSFLFGFGFRIYYPIHLKRQLFLEPQFGLSFNWLFADVGGDVFQIALNPGVRLRYDLARSFAVYLQAFRLDIIPYTNTEAGRVKGTFVYLHGGAGIEIRY